MKDRSCNVFFFKQKTAYEMRISDWSSDVCSSDLLIEPFAEQRLEGGHQPFEILRMRLLRGPRPNRIIAVEKAAQSRHFLLRLARHDGIDAAIDKIGRASCRESVCQYV